MKVIQRLYEIEAEAKERALDPAGRLALRRTKSAAIVEEFFAGVKKLKVVPSTPLATAVTYALNQELALRRFLEDGRLEIDNNATERALRHVALGRKAWLFAGNTDGAKRAATAYSLIVGCRQLGLDPYEYLRDVLERISTHPAKLVHELTPRGWHAAHPPAAPPSPA